MLHRSFVQNYIKKCESDQWTGRGEHTSTSLHFSYSLDTFIKVLRRVIKKRLPSISTVISFGDLHVYVFFYFHLYNFSCKLSRTLKFIGMAAVAYYHGILISTANTHQTSYFHFLSLTSSTGKCVSAVDTLARVQDVFSVNFVFSVALRE